MGHAFEHRHELTVPASPEQVREAITTGPGIDSWFSRDIRCLWPAS